MSYLARYVERYGAASSAGDWHRLWLLRSELYIRTSDPDRYRLHGLRIVGESGPELVSFRRGDDDE